MYFIGFSRRPGTHRRCLHPRRRPRGPQPDTTRRFSISPGSMPSSGTGRDEFVVPVDSVGDVRQGIRLRGVLGRDCHLEVERAPDRGEDVAVLDLLGEPPDAVHLETLRLCLGHPGRRGDAAGHLDGRIAVRRGQRALGRGRAAFRVEDLRRQRLDQVGARGSDLGRGGGDRNGRGPGAAPGEHDRAECGEEELGHTESWAVSGSKVQMWTTGQVSVRVMPGTFCTRATTSLPSSSTLRASARTITSYGPVTSSARVTPWTSAICAATSAALPTSVWIRM